MTALSTEQASAFSGRLRDQTVILTGAGSGIGRAVALRFASYGANLVLGDLDPKGLAAVVSEIERAGGRCVSARCDVTKWEDQTRLFELALKTYGSIDVVLPNAGVTEMFSFDVGQNSDGTLSPPNLKTLDVNLTAVLHSSALAIHYFSRFSKPGHKSLKALVITGSMSSFMGAKPPAPVYTASKAGVLGIVNGLKDRADQEGFRVALVCPYFVQTNLLPKDFQPDARLGFADINDVASAFLAACTDPDEATSGSSYTIPDSKGVLRLSPRDLPPKGFSGLSKKQRSKL